MAEYSHGKLTGIINNVSENDNDLDSSLTIAAEVGNLLLEKNNILNQEIRDLKIKCDAIQAEFEDKLKVADEKTENLVYNIEKLNKERQSETTFLENKVRANSEIMEDMEIQLQKEQERYEKEKQSYESKIKSLEELRNKSFIEYQEKLDHGIVTFNKTKEQYQAALSIKENLIKAQDKKINQLNQKIESLTEVIKSRKIESQSEIEKSLFGNKTLESTNAILSSKPQYLETAVRNTNSVAAPNITHLDEMN
ncbi:hypothetical protein J6590_062454 [Homalodisca vitripennis]|nr:hypothetical protein J6590_062454 [Homalodisca vitripennis]